MILLGLIICLPSMEAPDLKLQDKVCEGKGKIGEGVCRPAGRYSL